MTINTTYTTTIITTATNKKPTNTTYTNTTTATLRMASWAESLRVSGCIPDLTVTRPGGSGGWTYFGTNNHIRRVFTKCSFNMFYRWGSLS